MKFIGKVLILLGCNPNKYHDIKNWFDIDFMVDADMKLQEWPPRDLGLLLKTDLGYELLRHLNIPERGIR